jgi:hypothetical protein
MVDANNDKWRQLPAADELCCCLCCTPAGARQWGAVPKEVLAIIQVQHRVGLPLCINGAVAYTLTGDRCGNMMFLGSSEVAC